MMKYLCALFLFVCVLVCISPVTAALHVSAIESGETWIKWGWNQSTWISGNVPIIDPPADLIFDGGSIKIPNVATSFYIQTGLLPNELHSCTVRWNGEEKTAFAKTGMPAHPGYVPIISIIVGIVLLLYSLHTDSEPLALLMLPLATVFEFGAAILSWGIYGTVAAFSAIAVLIACLVLLLIVMIKTLTKQ